jgi:hypothetical protein
LSRGIGASRAQLYGVNAFEVESAHVGFSLGCTSLALDGSRSDSGEPRLAYNHDFPAAFAPFLFVRRSAPRAAIRSLTLTYPAMVGAICGVNEGGLAMSYDQAYATDGARARPATLVSLMVQRCLDRCATVDDAIALIAEHTAASGAMVTMVDRSGARACVELSMTRQAVRRARAGEILYTFNKYRTDTLASVEIPVGAVTTGIAKGYDIHACNLTRERRFLSLDAGQIFSDASLSALMGDHDGGDGDPLTICTHGDPMSETILHALVDPTESSLTVRFGHPCKTAPTRYDLATDSARADTLSASMA